MPVSAARRAEGVVFAATGWLAAGYLAAWTAFALIAAFAQCGPMQLALLTPAALTTFVLREGLGPEGKFIPRGGGLVAIAAGIMFIAQTLI
jgi:predicted metal-binding membrane protein